MKKHRKQNRHKHPIDMEAKFTKGRWFVNHWEKGESGVVCRKHENGITFYSGDAVESPIYSIVSNCPEHNIQASFEGAHIATITDFSDESMANARLIVAAPELLEACIAVNKYFVRLQNRCALTATDKRAWKLISKVIKKATE